MEKEIAKVKKTMEKARLRDEMFKIQKELEGMKA
jgi:hypothetical protein